MFRLHVRIQCLQVEKHDDSVSFLQGTQTYALLSLRKLPADGLEQLLHFCDCLIQSCSHLLLPVNLLLPETQ